MSSFVCPATELKLECDMTLFEQRLTFPTTFGDRFRIWSVTNNIQSMGGYGSRSMGVEYGRVYGRQHHCKVKGNLKQENPSAQFGIATKTSFLK